MLDWVEMDLVLKEKTANIQVGSRSHPHHLHKWTTKETLGGAHLDPKAIVELTASDLQPLGITAAIRKQQKQTPNLIHIMIQY